jgi:hypothetical protein
MRKYCEIDYRFKKYYLMRREKHNSYNYYSILLAEWVIDRKWNNSVMGMRVRFYG